jgi:hypothetical protein
MTPRKRRYIIIFFAGFILMLSGFGSSYYWLTRIYLPEKIDANTNAKKMKEWEGRDTFSPPTDGQMTRRQLHLFIQVNESLTYLIHRLHDQFEDHSWRFAFDLIQMQPEWAASKYLALKKHHISPKEYDWIFDQVVVFMVYRWKEDAIKKLRHMGWDFSQTELSKTDIAVNYKLFIDNEKELRRIFEIFWPEESTEKELISDSL